VTYNPCTSKLLELLSPFLRLLFFTQNASKWCVYRQTADELNKMRMKEKYLNNQHNALGLAFIEVDF
jgi:hypothetical protein